MAGHGISVGRLFMITKIQKLSAIHNLNWLVKMVFFVVYDYKDTKIVSNSQPPLLIAGGVFGCL